MFTNWIKGETARLEINVWDQSGAALDASSIALKVTSPGGALQTMLAGQIEHAGTGIYHFDLPLNQPGHWYWRWDVDGSAIEGHLSVQPSRFA